MPEVRHLLSIADLDRASLLTLVERGLAFRRGAEHGRPLEGRMVGIHFLKSSTRTRTSFTVAAARLGASVIAFGPGDLQTNTGETLADTGRVLSGYLDILVTRTAESVDEMRVLARQSRMAVINAMSDREHPTQAIADLTTMHEQFGHLEGLHVLYVGEGNNTAAALALAMAKVGRMRLTVLTPEGFGLGREIEAQAQAIAGATGTRIDNSASLERLPAGVDVVYTTRWQTTGTTRAGDEWKHAFAPFRISPELMARASQPGHTVLMHDLPAIRGEDVDSVVLDGPQSIAFRQAENKLYSSMAVLEWCGARTGLQDARTGATPKATVGSTF